MEELKNQIKQMFAHVHSAKSELEQMNVGKAHEELTAALSVPVTIDEDGLDMNDKVTCELTAGGAKIINAHCERINECYPSDKPAKTDYKEGDVYENTFWIILSLLPISKVGQDVYIKNIKKSKK